MSDLPLFISEYGLYLFIGIVCLAAIGVFAIRNAKECALPAECFDCKESTCLKCSRVNQESEPGQWAWKPNLENAPMLACGDTAGSENSLLPGK
ncbi:MAG: hypothetical protein P8Z69_03190 [Acidihalobacter sp.]